MYSWVGGKHVCVNLIGISTLVGLITGEFSLGYATLEVTSSKMVKHENVCSNNQHTFIPFAFDTFLFPRTRDNESLAWGLKTNA